MKTIFLDETGYTGAILADQAQPVFILAVLYALGLCIYRFIIEKREPFACLKDILNSVQKMIPSQRLGRFQNAGELLEGLERV